MHKLDCLRCGERMGHAGTQRFQLGQTGWVLGDLPNLLAGSMDLELYYCPKCSKVEFYIPEEEQPYTHTDMPQVKCPKCGASHDFDYPKCPHCGHAYPPEPIKNSPSVKTEGLVSYLRWAVVSPPYRCCGDLSVGWHDYMPPL